jgi:hypothetical protein
VNSMRTATSIGIALPLLMRLGAELLPWTVPYRQYVRDGGRRAGTGGRR